MMFIRLLTLICLFTADIQATSHWMVTETGLIQPKENSPFLMENPFDLLSFLNQDARWQNIFNIYYELVLRQTKINELWLQLEIEADFNRHLVESQNCVKAGSLDAIDWYTSFLEDGRFKGIPEKEFLLHTYKHGDTDVPDCKKISSLTFSMFAFEHLEGMMHRENLNATPEFTLPELFSPIMTVNQYGHWLSDILRKNSSSWLHYNLASIYWRVKGNVPKALECSRRAVHYAPRKHKSIALLCMGSILHRSQKSDDAIIVLGAAVDHDPFFPISHFALGAALAVYGEFNSSIKHFDISLKGYKNFDLATRFRNAVLCHIDMAEKIKIARNTLTSLLDEIQKYSKTDMVWIRIQAAFLKTMKHEDKYDYKNVDNNLIKMSEITGLKFHELLEESRRNSLIQYFLEGPIYKEEWAADRGVNAIETAHALQRVMSHLQKHPGFPPKVLDVDSALKNRGTTFLKEIGPMPSFPVLIATSKYISPMTADVKRSLEKKVRFGLGTLETGVLKHEAGMAYPPNMKVNRNREIFDTDPEWPSNKFCKETAAKFPDNIELVYPVFMPFENKGIRLSSLLTESIGVPALVEHELPWHPPICPHDKETVLHTQKKGLKVTLVNEAIAVDYLRTKLLRYLSDSNLDILKRMQDAEIGQRIHTAMKRKIASKWILYTIAGLYWRVRSNTVNALHCFLSASRVVEPKARDVVLLSLASLYLEMGLLDDCASTIEEAYKINPYEPTTNFVLAQLSLLKKNHKAQIFHLKQTIRVDPKFLNGAARNLLYAWACILQQVHNNLKPIELAQGWHINTIVADSIDDKEFCAEVEPGMSMVCESDGTNCHISKRNCNSLHRQSESALLRILEREDQMPTQQHYLLGIDEVDEEAFEQFIEAMPQDRRDKAAHQNNYNSMVNTVDKLMKGCGYRGCGDMRPEDLAMKEEDCSYQYLQLDYWLHVINFKQQLSEGDSRLPSEILGVTASNRRIPDCRLPSDSNEDFFTERIMKVDVNGWEPLLSSMHQFAELFNVYDYAVLGAKIAKYVEAKPSSWLGLTAGAWWCGASGRGACAVRCAAAAHRLAPPARRHLALRPLAVILHMQSKRQDAKEVAYLSLYTSPKTKVEAFLVAVSHTYENEYEQAVWMYRYALTFDEKFLPAKACLHITMCLMLFGEGSKKKLKEIPA